ncbi:hypothetical protein E8E14_001207 [Neopestalotiopsis sp. 37M]|nr:hypothetical protein E8E14_001207 [Neopestalotiopsis sp. 37M]
MSKYEDNCVLLNLTSEDEKDLDSMQENDLDITELLRRVPAALPKVYKDWAPHKTQLHITSDGMRILLRDSAKRVLIKAIVGNFKEENTPNNNQGPNITSTLAMPAERHIQQPAPSTPSQRKTTDNQHRDRVIAAPSETSRPNPFKQAKIQRELFVDVKRAPSGQDANKSILDSKVYDPRSIKPVPGGFEIAFNADGFGGYSMGLSSTMIGVPSDLARRMREQAMSAANSNNTKLGNTRDDRAQAGGRQFMSTWSEQEAFLLDLTSQDETQILRTNNGEVYTSVGQALRCRAPAIPMVSIYKDWDPSATAMERKADGQVLVMFKDFSGKTLMGVVIKE